MASYVAGVLILLAGFVLIALVKPWSRVVPSRVPRIGGRKIRPGILLVPTLLCSAFAMAHGISGVITKALSLSGFMTIHLQGWKVVDVQRLFLWDMLFYEPWFIVMGALAGLTALHYAQASDIPPSVIKRSAVLFLGFVAILAPLFVGAIIVLF